MKGAAPAPLLVTHGLQYAIFDKTKKLLELFYFLFTNYTSSCSL